MSPLPARAPRIEAERLYLRELSERDEHGLFRIYSDPAVMQFMSQPPMQSLEEARRRIRRIRNTMLRGEGLEWVLVLKDRAGDDAIGTCSLFHHDAQNRRAELGFLLASDFQGRGLMSEAARGVIRFGLETLDLMRIEADTDPRNESSCRLLERLGFKQEGLLRKRWCVAGEWSDTAFFGLLKEEWRAGGGLEHGETQQEAGERRTG